MYGHPATAKRHNSHGVVSPPVDLHSAEAKGNSLFGKCFCHVFFFFFFFFFFIPIPLHRTVLPLEYLYNIINII